MSDNPCQTASPAPRPLRSGYTTGACAAAASKGAALMLKHQVSVREVSLTLPTGIQATFLLHGQTFGPGSASCFVVKDAGDDPDVTNGVEVHARVTESSPPSAAGVAGLGVSATIDNVASPPPSLSLPQQEGGNIIIEGGTGIGRVTKPGLAVPPGEWAINPVPRRMIEDAVTSALFPTAVSRQRAMKSYRVTITIPDGEERAKKTLNARLGIIGGISILGTTGVVRPVSAKAWTDTIDAALDVARACGCTTVVLSTGRTSELAVQKMFAVRSSLFDVDGHEYRTRNLERLPEEAYVMMGDHIAYALKACSLRGFREPVIACQFAKLLKIACGHENTHAAASELDLGRLLSWAEAAGLGPAILETIARANTAREIALACAFDRNLVNLLFDRACQAAVSHSPDLSPHFIVADYSGNCVSHHRHD